MVGRCWVAHRNVPEPELGQKDSSERLGEGSRVFFRLKIDPHNCIGLGEPVAERTRPSIFSVQLSSHTQEEFAKIVRRKPDLDHVEHVFQRFDNSTRNIADGRWNVPKIQGYGKAAWWD